MKFLIWLDDIRNPPYGKEYENAFWFSSVNSTKDFINMINMHCIDDAPIFYLDLDHDLGDCASEGGDAIKLLDWLEETDMGDKCVFRLHTANPVGSQNMERIIKRNGWLTW